MARITSDQRTLLEAAFDHGDPWKVGGEAQPRNPSRAAAIETLVMRGFLERQTLTITAAGCVLLRHEGN